MRANRKLAGAVALALMLAAPATAAPVTIAALGDSLTQGYGLPAGQGFVPQMQAWLEKKGAEVTLINAGVSGDTTAGGLSRVDWTLTDDVDGMIVALGGNDMLRGVDPAVTRANLDAIVKAAHEKDVTVLLVGLAAPGNYGPAFKRDFDAIFPELAAKHDTLLFRNFMQGLAAQPDMQGAARDYMQADGIHPNARGVKLIVQAMGPRVLDLVNRIRAR